MNKHDLIASIAQNTGARVAKNPRTGDAIKIPKRRVVRFTPGKVLKNAVR